MRSRSKDVLSVLGAWYVTTSKVISSFKSSIVEELTSVAI